PLPPSAFMTRPAIELADIVRRKGKQFLQRVQAVLSYQQLKACRAVERCRTAALGGHKDKSVDCQYEAPISFNSCRSRCCPKSQRKLASDGSRRSSATSSTPTTSTLSSPCRTN